MDNLIIREAVIEDAKLLFNLSNEDDVRQNSIIQDKIEWDKHLIWLKSKLQDKNYKLFVFFEDANFVGQVKYELGNKLATISISITKSNRGKGYAREMLLKSIEELIEKNTSIESIIALIKPSNKASISSFLKVGFSYFEDIKINEIHFCKYLLKLN